MASLRDAEQARAEASDLLRELGAHAISVEPDPGEVPLQPVATPVERTTAPTKAATTGPTTGPTKAATKAEPGRGAGSAAPKSARHPRSTYAVVAWFEGEPPDSVPAQIHVAHRRGTSAVPVKIRRAEAFAPEQPPTAAVKTGPDDIKPE